ncbi:MAG: restriction endonuclease subunit S [Shewanella sp.]
MLPNGWNTYHIAEILERISIPVKPVDGVNYREIGIRSHGKGIFHKENTTAENIGNKRVFEIVPNALVLNIVFAWEQAVARISNDEQGFIASHRFPQFLPKNNLCDIDYLLYFFKTLKGKYLLNLASPGGAGRNKTLGQKEFENLALLLPPTVEQRKIVNILSTWDKAISTTEQLMDNTKQQKKALTQQVLTGRKRFPRFNIEWREEKLKDCIDSLDNKRVPLNSTQRKKMAGNIPYWGANGIVGYVNDYLFNETIVLLAEDGGYFEKYQNRSIANISYGKSWVNNHAHILRAKSSLSNEWLYYSLVHKNILGFINGGTRAKLNKSDMLNIFIKIPCKDEQKSLVRTFQNIDKEIGLLEQQLADLKQEKKALMQQLLTGKRRVQIKEMEVA